MTNWCIDRLTKVYTTRIEDFYRDNTPEVVSSYPAGIVGIPSAFMGRYREFDICLGNLILPPGSEPAWGLGGNPAHSMNQFIRKMLETDRFQWLWIIGDDHVFTVDIIIRLLSREKDVVVPFCCRRTYPYDPTVHANGDIDNDWKSVETKWFKGKSGLVNLNDSRNIAGNAGMLIRRRVFESMEDPWFEMGKVHSEYGSPDLWFAKKITEAGFDIWLDMDTPIGHLTHMGVWPYYDFEKKEWRAEMRYPDDVWGQRGLFVD